MIAPFDLPEEIRRRDWRGGPASREAVAFASMPQIAVQICGRRGVISQSFRIFVQDSSVWTLGVRPFSRRKTLPLPHRFDYLFLLVGQAVGQFFS
jgi:hypothetical protein